MYHVCPVGVGVGVECSRWGAAYGIKNLAWALWGQVVDIKRPSPSWSELREKKQLLARSSPLSTFTLPSLSTCPSSVHCPQQHSPHSRSKRFETSGAYIRHTRPIPPVPPPNCPHHDPYDQSFGPVNFFSLAHFAGIQKIGFRSSPSPLPASQSQQVGGLSWSSHQPTCCRCCCCCCCYCRSLQGHWTVKLALCCRTSVCSGDIDTPPRPVQPSNPAARLRTLVVIPVPISARFRRR